MGAGRRRSRRAGDHRRGLVGDRVGWCREGSRLAGWGGLGAILDGRGAEAFGSRVESSVSWWSPPCAAWASPMKFVCDNCQAKYQIGDDKVAGKTVRMKCRKCGYNIKVSPPARGRGRRRTPQAQDAPQSQVAPFAPQRSAACPCATRRRQQARGARACRLAREAGVAIRSDESTSIMNAPRARRGRRHDGPCCRRRSASAAPGAAPRPPRPAPRPSAAAPRRAPAPRSHAVRGGPAPAGAPRPPVDHRAARTPGRSPRPRAASRLASPLRRGR